MSIFEIALSILGALLGVVWLGFLVLLIATAVAAIRCVMAPTRQSFHGVARLVATDLFAFEVIFIASILFVGALFGLSGVDIGPDDGVSAASTSADVIAAFLMVGALVVFSGGILAMWSQRVPLRRQVIVLSLMAFIALNVFVFAIA